MIEEKKEISLPKRRPQVNQKCIWCGACVAICSDVFEFDIEWLAKAIRLDNYEWRWVEDAISACPVDAITWIEV